MNKAVTEADTINEITPNLTDALEALIEMYEDLKKPLPKVLQPIDMSELIYLETIIKTRKYAGNN